MLRCIALTGTPGTGKTTVAALLPYRVIDVNALVKEGLNLGLDAERNCLEADMDALASRLKEICDEMARDLRTSGSTDDTSGPFRDVVVLEGHLSHHFALEAVVLRLSPSNLRARLEARGYSEEKVRENLEAEALDVILVESVELCETVHEIDVTSRRPTEVAALVVAAVEGQIRLLPGSVDWLEDLEFDLG